MQRNTWYYLGINSCQQMLYCLKRINDPIREHVGNHFTPLPECDKQQFVNMRDTVISMYEKAIKMLESGDYSNAEHLRNECTNVQNQLSSDRKLALDCLTPSNMETDAKTSSANTQSINTLLLTVHVLQESQELIGCLRHMLRGMNKFASADNK